ncbi:MAG TPA: divalent-cation tolerance protein CutA [Pyrinomonadaceae bacterium]|jgi:periplasmic divalent cation tolerance protein|nr:divalent-cation tolerance protein CutA [Pyrinomonadaceae bacterium]
MPASSEPIVVMMTAASAEEASRIGEMLVSQKLAACVQVLPPIQSIYVWQGEVQRESEILILAKTTQSNFAELERQVRAIHSYETPEIIALPIVCGSKSYLDWLFDVCDAS